MKDGYAFKISFKIFKSNIYLQPIYGCGANKKQTTVPGKILALFIFHFYMKVSIAHKTCFNA